MTANQTKILKTALLDFALSKADYYESLDIKEPSYSEKFKNKITELSQRKNSSKSKRITFILIAAVITILLVASASAVALKLGDFIVDVYEKYIEVHFRNDSNNTTIQEIYAPTYLPIGYSKQNDENFDKRHNTSFSNGTYEIVLLQKARNTATLTFDNENFEYKNFTLDEKIVHYYTKYNTSVYMWSFDEYIFTINAPAEIPLEEIKMMISSMEIAEK